MFNDRELVFDYIKLFRIIQCQYLQRNAIPYKSPKHTYNMNYYFFLPVTPLSYELE